jgi:dihydrolipoamide dehydrogenase
MSENTKETQLLVIGGGPGGYPAAIRAADQGIKPILVDEGAKLGGVCSNRGCIPSKALLHIAQILDAAKQAEEWGVSFGNPTIDLQKLQGFVQQKIVGKLGTGIGALCKGRGVEVLSGSRATLVGPNTARVEGAWSGTITFRNAIVATGSVPAIPPSFAMADPRVMDSTAALNLPDIPKRMLVVGGGYIGLEIGTVYAALGTKVVVVEFTDGLLPTCDRDLVRPVEDRLRKRFEAIHLSTTVVSLEPTAAGIVATLEGTVPHSKELFDRVLISVGRRPNTNQLGLDQLGVRMSDRGHIIVDPQRRTSVPHIFAIGDVTGEPGLAHKATAEAKVAVDAIRGEPSAFEPRAIPAVVFTDPEIAWAGLTERDAVREGTLFPWAASGRAVTIARTDGFTKLLVEPESKRILGMGIVGAGAGELIAEAALAIEMGAVARDLADTIHAHPTLSETIMESAELSLGSATHVAKPKKIQR